MTQNILKVALGLFLLATLGFAFAGDTVNKKCPVGNEPVDGKTVVEVDGEKVGLCCSRCKTAFAAWDADKKSAFVTRAKTAANQEGKAAGQVKVAEKAPAKLASAPYLLDVCAVSGEKLGSMGDPIVKQVAGRQVKFCCKGCVDPYTKSPERYAARIDAAMAAQQSPYYALKTCVVSGEALGDAPIDTVVGNNLVRTCCKMCAKKVTKEPAAFVAQVERANAKAQTKDYPVKTCAVSGEELGSMGDPIEKVVAGRLVKLCCKGCARGLEKNPAKIVAEVDKAWAPIHARKAAAK